MKTVSHSRSHATPAEQLKFLTDEARKALAIFNRLPMQELFRRNAENDVLALAIEQASDLIATALNILSAQPTNYEFDPYGEAEQAGMQFALRLFGQQIAGVERWEGGDGSETVEGDVIAEYQNIGKAAGWVDEHGDASFGPPAIASIPPHLYWLIGKGRTRPAEPFYAVQLIDPESGIAIAEAEAEQLADAINAAVEKLATCQRQEG